MCKYISIYMQIYYIPGMRLGLLVRGACQGLHRSCSVIPIYIYIYIYLYIYIYIYIYLYIYIYVYIYIYILGMRLGLLVSGACQGLHRSCSVIPGESNGGNKDNNKLSRGACQGLHRSCSLITNESNVGGNKDNNKLSKGDDIVVQQKISVI
jgi:hypothetical protein